MAPAPVPQLDTIPFRTRSLYRRMGLMVDSTRMPFVASLRFLGSRAPDSTLVVFGLSFANRVLNFRRDAAEFVAAYHIELVLRRDSTFSRTVSRDATVRVATAPETMRRDESVVFQQLLTVPPGVYNVMAVVRDLNSPAYARVDIVDTVPRFPFTSLGALPLYDGPGRLRIDTVPKLVVNPRGTVKFGTDTLHFYVEGYGLAAGTRLAARVLDADSVELWTDTVTLKAGTATGAALAAEAAGAADGKGMKQGRAARPGAEAGVAAAAGARAVFGAGAGADSSLVRSGAGAGAGAAAGAGASGMFGGAGAADADTSVRAAGSMRGVLGADGATAAAGDIAAAGGAGGEAGAAARAGVRGLMGAGADSAHAGAADSASARRDSGAVAAAAPATAGAPPAGAGGALSAAGIAPGAGALIGAGAISAKGLSGISAGADAADVGARARTAGARGSGPELLSLMNAEFVIPPATLPLGLQTFVVQAVGAAPRTEAPFLVGFSDPWAVKTFPQMVALLRYYPRTDLVAKLKAAPRADRAKAWREFLHASDPTPKTSQHDSLEAYFLRIDQANRRFLEPAGPGWRTDRGEVYVNLGEPDNSYEVPGRHAPGIKWEFNSLHVTLSFADPDGSGQYHLTTQSRIDYERALSQVRNAP